MWLVFGEDCSLMKNIIYSKLLLPQRVTFIFVFCPSGPPLTVMKALQTPDACSDSSLSQSMQNYAVEVSFSYFEWRTCWSITVAGSIVANFVWLSRYVCPVVRAVTPVRVWCMMKRSWLVGQLTILTSIAHAPFAALRFCLCSMWTSETWVTRKGNLVCCNHTIDISMEIFTISNCFLFYLIRSPSPQVYDAAGNISSNGKKDPVRIHFSNYNSLHFSVSESYFECIRSLL